MLTAVSVLCNPEKVTSEYVQDVWHGFSQGTSIYKISRWRQGDLLWVKDKTHSPISLNLVPCVIVFLKPIFGVD